MQDLSRPETRNQQDVKILCNCLSLFTRWLPFVFESPSLISLWDPSQSGATAGMGNVESLHPNKTPDAFQSPVDGAFNQSALRPLGQRLMDAVVRLLFFPGFTLPEDLLDPQNPIQYIVWYPLLDCILLLGILIVMIVMIGRLVLGHPVLLFQHGNWMRIVSWCYVCSWFSCLDPCMCLWKRFNNNHWWNHLDRLVLLYLQVGVLVVLMGEPY